MLATVQSAMTSREASSEQQRFPHVQSRTNKIMIAAAAKKTPKKEIKQSKK